MAKLSTLIDDFQDGVINSSLWLNTAGVVETGGRVIITPTVTSRSLQSQSAYDATSSQIIVHLPVVTNVGITGTLLTGIALNLNNNNEVGMVKEGADILAIKKVAGVETVVATFTYNSVSMAYWRLRESADIFYWEISPNGTSWSQIFSTTVSTNLFSLSSVVWYVYSFYSGFEPSPGTAQIESVNLGQQITASGASTSTGTLALLIRHTLTGSAASTSSGSLAITIPPLTAHALTGTGASTSTGTLSFIILAPSQMTAAAQSYSSGSLAFQLSSYLTAIGQSFSTGTLEFTVLTPAPVPPDILYYYFEPPIAYDLPPTLPNPRPRYINAHARWKGGQRRGRSVLKLNGEYVTIDTPTVDQTLAATEVYMGGHIHLINHVVANALSAAGYEVTPITTTWTLYPNEDVFPLINLYPGYQEFVPV